MKYMTAEEAAGRWGVSVRRVRNYCAGGFVAGALRSGGRWRIPEDAAKPCRSRAASAPRAALLEALRREKAAGISGGIYHKVQIELTYNSNHIEGGSLTHDQTRYIFETDTIAAEGVAGPPSAERGFYQKASPRPQKRHLGQQAQLVRRGRLQEAAERSRRGRDRAAGGDRRADAGAARFV